MGVICKVETSLSVGCRHWYHKLFDANSPGQVCRSGCYFNSSSLAVLRVMSLCALVIVVCVKKIDISDENPYPRR